MGLNMSKKACTGCKVEKDLGEYHKHSTGKMGRAGRCKECRKLDSKKYYEENKGSKLAYSAEYYKANSEYKKSWQREYGGKNRDRIKRSSKMRYVANRDSILVQKKRYYNKNREDIKRKVREHRERNPLYQREYNRRRKLRRKAHPNYVKVSYSAIVKRDKSTCYLCYAIVAKSDMTFDHIIPESKGGAHAFYNVAITHRGCNAQKHAKLPHEMPEPIRTRIYAKIAELRGLPRPSE